MAFDFGFDFRNAQGFVTDPAFCAWVSGNNHLYPFTFTNSNGDSVNGGWDNTSPSQRDIDNVDDPRLAGTNEGTDSQAARVFLVDINSGSAPGPGQYSLDLALGRGTGAFGGPGAQYGFVADGATVLVDFRNAGSGIVLSNAGSFLDATLTEVPTGPTWNGTQILVTFAGNQASVSIAGQPGGSAAEVTALSHFRLSVPTGGGGGGAGACECSYFHSFEYREVSDFMDCVVGRRS